MMVLSSEIIRDRGGLNAIAREWNDLVARSASNVIFLTWEWISSWLDAVCPNARLLTVVLRDSNGRLAAIAPFYQVKLSFCGLVSYRCLRVAGDTESGSDYPDVIVQEDSVAEGCGAVADALQGVRGEWDCIWLPNASAWSGATGELKTAGQSRRFHVHERPRDFGSLALPSDYETYLASLSGNMRSSIRRQTKRFQAAHALEFVRARSADELPGLLKRLFTLNRRRWESVGEPGAFADDTAKCRFYEHMAPRALERDWLGLYALRVDGEIQAVQYGYCYSGVYYQIQEGYAPELKGAGIVLRAHVIQTCIHDSVEQYDFLGGYTDHKRRWGAVERTGRDIFLGRPCLKNRVLFAKEIWPTGRYITQTSPNGRARRAPVASSSGR